MPLALRSFMPNQRWTINLAKLFPETKNLLAVSKEILGLVLLKELHEYDQKRQKCDVLPSIGLIKYNSAIDLNSPLNTLLKEEVEEKIRSAWKYLEYQNYITLDPSQRGKDIYTDYIKLTKEGIDAANNTDNSSFGEFNKFSWEHLHPLIKDKVKKHFQNKHYENAVSDSFKAVEIHVRKACAFGDETFGVDLMRKAFAFDKTCGPLVSQNSTEDSNGSPSHLFAGALGLYRNPVNHWHIVLNPLITFHQITLASLLLYEVDGRKITTN